MLVQADEEGWIVRTLVGIVHLILLLPFLVLLCIGAVGIVVIETVFS